jgi:rare lipoprotein A
MRIQHRLALCFCLVQLAACSSSVPPLVGTQEALKDNVQPVQPVVEALVAPTVAPVPELSAAPPDGPFQQGRPAWYRRSKFTHTTASGEALDDRLLTAAHLTLPLGSYLRVVDTATENSVIVRVNDRGPYSRVYIIDLSKSAANALGMFRTPKMIVRLEPLPGVPATPVPVSKLPTGAAALAALGGGKPKAAAKSPGSNKTVTGTPSPVKPKVATTAKPAPKKPSPLNP